MVLFVVPHPPKSRQKLIVWRVLRGSGCRPGTGGVHVCHHSLRLSLTATGFQSPPCWKRRCCTSWLPPSSADLQQRGQRWGHTGRSGGHFIGGRGTKRFQLLELRAEVHISAAATVVVTSWSQVFPSSITFTTIPARLNVVSCCHRSRRG